MSKTPPAAPLSYQGLGLRLNRRQGLSALMMGVLGWGLGAFAAKASTDTKPLAPPELSFADWSDEDPEYVFFPGDKIEVQFPTAPELNRTQTILPDGRISLGLMGQIMVAYRSVSEVTALIKERLGPILKRPDVSVYVTETAPMRLLVGGEVKNPGFVEMIGDMDALSAVMAAGGFAHTAKTRQVVLIRRSNQGQAMRKIIDLQAPLKGTGNHLFALKRMDIVFVPRTHVAEAGVYVEQYVNNLIPGGILNYFTYRVFN